MSLAVEARPVETSVFTYLEKSPVAEDEGITLFSRASAESANAPWEEIFGRLIDIGRLEDDWDGGGSAAPDAGVVSAAYKLALTLKSQNEHPPGRVTPSVNGTICFEWHTPDGYQEIEVTSPVDAEVSWVANGATIADVAVIPIV